MIEIKQVRMEFSSDASVVVGRARLGSTETTSYPGDTQNRCRLASCWIPAVLEMAFQSQPTHYGNICGPSDECRKP